MSKHKGILINPINVANLVELSSISTLTVIHYNVGDQIHDSIVKKLCKTDYRIDVITEKIGCSTMTN